MNTHKENRIVFQQKYCYLEIYMLMKMYLRSTYFYQS